ncbi:hypothetical protein COY25_02795 [Candidatus Uhrbacteria bacterium CG_4_10_14_0_2_um_filter_41_7]|uniref:Uncharacterized protein n=1 Tax=Candidatus Uhrbacteria bacterium CG_4_9_14_3_um_filter_41_35 TaxID=1975034 RepID=A0A2M7XG15_9BACT|nr:MAG: hypothetical protein COV92_01360 [Candidatus Uhrbacteria bacterium CG11_big_fil_rev_8_21_14_0_20_41_9]PIZ53937.1 MAG: hypothetical protein COY25_02795 [Candidatus Uhrbacteria bacterium CG_4_10_14_0_2_um_filter_41_7]PJA46676.1 MAG: hypothetical protein CO173_02820 [Candidatus Uhrbacteria bacterium CG_4_9_14_3_um_filter_41_35]
MHQLLNEPIEVLVEFKGKHVKPRRIRWGNNIYDMNAFNLVHGVLEGTKQVFYFSVSDATNFMKLRFETESLEWRLVELYTDG